MATVAERSGLKATTGRATTTTASEREHTLGVWIHTQRTSRPRTLDPAKLTLLDDAVPGAGRTGRTRGRPPRQ